LFVERVNQGKADPLERVTALFGGANAMAASRIQAKLTADYGPSTALVVRDTSGIDWDCPHGSVELQAERPLRGLLGAALTSGARRSR